VQNNKQRVFVLMAVAAAMTVIFITPLCGMLFKCGCVWIWSGAAAHCNIYHSEPPFCPWCSHGSAGFTLPAAGLFLGTFLCGFFIQKSKGKLLPAVVVTAIAVVPIGIGLGYLTTLLTSYPYFLFHH
jgi:hypothetical protein